MQATPLPRHSRGDEDKLHWLRDGWLHGGASVGFVVDPVALQWSQCQVRSGIAVLQQMAGGWS
jgi:hypothetical protein